MKMETLLKIQKLAQISMNQMEMKQKNQTVKNGERMKKHRKNGVKNGEKFIENFRNKNGAINGRLIYNQD